MSLLQIKWKGKKFLFVGRIPIKGIDFFFVTLKTLSCLSKELFVGGCFVHLLGNIIDSSLKVNWIFNVLELLIT